MKKFLLFAAAALVAVSASAATEKVVLASFYTGEEGSGTLGGWGGSSKFENVEEDGKPCMQVTNPEEMENDWQVQWAIGCEFENGETYYLEFEVKGTEELSGITSGLQNSSTYSGGGNFTTFDITKEWAKQTIECTCNADDIDRYTANMGKYVGTAWFTNVVLYVLKEVEDTPGEEDTKNILASFYAGEGSGTLGGWGGSSKIGNAEEDGKACLQVENPEEMENDWQVQWAMGYEFENGVTYYIDFEVKGTVEAEGITSGLQNSSDYSGGGNFTTFDITTDWAKQTIECTCNADNIDRYTANMGKYVGTAWFTNVILYTLDGNGVKTVIPVQMNNAVYNMQGVKVANSIDEVAAPGLYITNGKKIIKK